MGMCKESPAVPWVKRIVASWVAMAAVEAMVNAVLSGKSVQVRRKKKEKKRTRRKKRKQDMKKKMKKRDHMGDCGEAIRESAQVKEPGRAHLADHPSSWG